MNKALFIALAWCMLVTRAYSLGNITGKVIDSTTGQALPGATIYIHEFEKGVATNHNGTFSFEIIPSNEIILEVSFLGYETKIVTVHSSTEIIISLKPTLIETPEVVVSASNFASQHENAVKIDALNYSTLKASASPSFIEVMASVPGVDLISKGNGIGKPVIRGLSNSNILMLNNGIKMENYQFSEDHPYVIDDSGIDRVEIIKGPASLLYGSEAIGGLINVLPEHPASIGQTTGDFAIQGFSASKGYVITGGVKSSKQKLSWGIRAGLKNHRDYLDGNGNYVPNSRFSQQSAKSFINWNTNAGYYKISYEYNHLIPGISNAASVQLVNSNEYLKTIWFQDLSNHLLLSKNTFFVNKTKFNVNVSWQKNHRVLNTDEKNVVNMQLDNLNFELKTWLPSGKNNDIIVGLQSAKRWNKNNDAHIRVLPNYSINELAIIGLYQLRLMQKLSIQAGLRFDYRTLYVPEQEKASHSHDEALSDSIDVSVITPKLNFNYKNFSSSVGTTYELIPELLFRVNIASAFRPPNIAELTQDGMHGIRYEKGNTKLKSQRNYEADFSTHYHTVNFSADIAVFYNYIYNYIFLAPTNDFNESYRIYEYGQTNSRLYGSELNLRYHIFKWAEITGQFSTTRGLQADNSYLPFLPHDKVKFALNFEKENIGFLSRSYLNLSLLHALSQNRPSVFETPSAAYSILNLGIGSTIQIHKKLVQITINGNNLLNKAYFDHLSTLKEIGFYNTGINFVMNVKYTF